MKFQTPDSVSLPLAGLEKVESVRCFLENLLRTVLFFRHKTLGIRKLKYVCKNKFLLSTKRKGITFLRYGIGEPLRCYLDHFFFLLLICSLCVKIWRTKRKFYLSKLVSMLFLFSFLILIRFSSCIMSATRLSFDSVLVHEWMYYIGDVDILVA